MKKDIYYILTIVFLLIILTFSVSRCTRIQNTYKHNLIALNDTLHTYKAKNGQLVTKTMAYETSIKDLKLLNSSLYDEIDNLKGKITSATHFTGIITNTVHDTAYVISHDTINFGFEHDFAFKDKFHVLEGNVKYVPDTLDVKINRNDVFFDYTVALDKNNNIHITSTNPYVRFQEVSGFTLPKQRTKRWALGPYIGAGINLTTGKPEPQVGIGLTYGLIRF